MQDLLKHEALTISLAGGYDHCYSTVTVISISFIHLNS